MNVANKFLFFLVVLFAVNMSGEAQTFGGAVVGGLNMSQIDGDNASGFNKVGINAGLRGIILPYKKNHFYVELLYSQRGSLIRIGQGFNSEVRKINTSFAEIPVMFSINEWFVEDYYKVGLSFGLSYGRLVGFSTNLSEWESMEDVMIRNDLSGKLGLHYKFTSRFGVQVLASRSFFRLMGRNEAAGFGFPRRFNSYHLTIQALYEL